MLEIYFFGFLSENNINMKNNKEIDFEIKLKNNNYENRIVG
jgi:hypothetical protein